MENNIFILTGLIQSGKTTALMEFIQKNKSAGFLTPDIDGKRKLYSIANDRFHEMQTEESDPAEKIAIGMFLFRKDAFDKGGIIMNEYRGDADWFIVDEAGPLEIVKNTGFEPALSVLVEKFRKKKTRRQFADRSKRKIT